MAARIGGAALRAVHDRPARQICALGFGLAALLALAGLWLGGGLDGGPAGAAGLGLAAGWFATDRALARRERHEWHLRAPPELFDPALFAGPAHGEELAGRELRALRFVVFDTETTGLRPLEGDEMVSIGAVLVEGGAVRRRRFDRLVNPGRPIPRRSTRFHGITDAMVAEAELAGPVLAAFKQFCADAVLVAHNAAFDMAFLRRGQRPDGDDGAGAPAFDNLVLDTLILSAFLDREEGDHTLDAIAARHRVAIEQRHTALGDAMATAQVFAAMLDRLADRGVTTLDQALALSREMVAIRRRQRQFERR